MKKEIPNVKDKSQLPDDEPEIEEGEIDFDEGHPLEEDDIEAPKDPIQELRDQLQEKEHELKEKQDEYMRLHAETENFKKRLSREKFDSLQRAKDKLIKEIIPVYDNLERALNAPKITVENLKEGVEMILKQFTTFLQKENVRPMSSVGEPFDPSRHEAVSQLESDAHEEGTVIEEYAKGYLLKERVLIPAKVVIAKKPSVTTPQDPEAATE